MVLGWRCPAGIRPWAAAPGAGRAADSGGTAPCSEPAVTAARTRSFPWLGCPGGRGAGAGTPGLCRHGPEVTEPTALVLGMRHEAFESCASGAGRSNRLPIEGRSSALVALLRMGLGQALPNGEDGAGTQNRLNSLQQAVLPIAVFLKGLLKPVTSVF